jgi:putative ABC transport system ATP-binding protein
MTYQTPIQHIRSKFAYGAAEQAAASTDNGNNQNPLIQMHQIVKAYPTPAGQFLALKSVDLTVYPGEFVAITGKSGAGKTTLVNVLTGVDRATSGEVWVQGVPVHQLNEDRLALWRGQNVGIIYQSFYLMPTLSLLDNVLLPMEMCGRFHGRQSRAHAMDLLQMVEMEGHAAKLPAAISGGQQQRVAIARALANDPPIIVADEPTGSLDSLTADHIFQIFEHLIEKGKTIIMVTHDNSLAPRFMRHLVIQDGEIIAEKGGPA